MSQKAKAVICPGAVEELELVTLAALQQGEPMEGGKDARLKRVGKSFLAVAGMAGLRRTLRKIFQPMTTSPTQRLSPF